MYTAVVISLLKRRHASYTNWPHRLVAYARRALTYRFVVVFCLIYIMVKYSHINTSCLMCALSYKRIACSHLNVERIAITSYYILKYSTNPQEKVIHQRFSSRSIWRSIQRTHAREINNKYIIYIILYYIGSIRNWGRRTKTKVSLCRWFEFAKYYDVCNVI